MIDVNLTEAEHELCQLVWGHEPIKSGDLVKLCEDRFDWKKSTTYTMLKRVEEKGILKNKDGLVVGMLSQEAYLEEKGKEFVDENFGGSLPKFLTAFSKTKKLTRKEVDEIQKLINAYKEDNND